MKTFWVFPLGSTKHQVQVLYRPSFLRCPIEIGDFFGSCQQRQACLSEKNSTKILMIMRQCLRSLCVLDRASSWYLNKGWPTRWHLLYYLLLNMFQTLIRPSSGASDYLLCCCVGWLEACWCYVAGLSVGDVVSECRLNHYTRIPHHQQTVPLHNTSTPQVSLHNAPSSRKLLKMDVLTSETCWAVDNKASVI